MQHRFRYSVKHFRNENETIEAFIPICCFKDLDIGFIPRLYACSERLDYQDHSRFYPTNLLWGRRSRQEKTV
jgi:hypothetical protein